MKFQIEAPEWVQSPIEARVRLLECLKIAGFQIRRVEVPADQEKRDSGHSRAFFWLIESVEGDKNSDR